LLLAKKFIKYIENSIICLITMLITTSLYLYAVITWILHFYFLAFA
jgi:hypothetical protein